MSQVKISGDASGTGILTIAAPNTNSNFTLTLPAATGTFNTSGVVNEVPAGTAALPAITTTGDTNTGIFFPAADTIAFTEGGVESMRIDSSGNVGIGTSSPNKKLEVVSAGEIIRATSSTGANDQVISIKNNSGTADTSTNIFFADRYAASSFASSYIRGTASGTSVLIFATGGTNFTNIFDAGAPTERMRIDTSGNVGIGTSSPAAKLDLNKGSAGLLANFTDGVNTNFQISTSGFIATAGPTAGSTSLAFQTGGTERARIDSSGNLLVGGTSQVWDERELVRSDTNTVKLGIYGNNAAYTSSIIRAQVETAAGIGFFFFEGRAAGGAFQYGIRGNGTVTTSDERRKKNIETARDGYIQDLCQLRVVKYNWKSDEEGAPKELGLIAQEVEQVFPGLIVTHHDGPNDDQEVKLLKKDVFVPMLIKAIQEQQALITALTARITALEAI